MDEVSGPLAVRLMNTVELDRGEVRDRLEVATWPQAVADELAPALEEAGQVDAESVGDALRELRNALRRLAAAVTDDPRPAITMPELSRPAATAVLNGLLPASPELVWQGDRPTLQYAAHGTAAELVVGVLARQGAELIGGEQRQRLRACLAPNCDRFFLKDHPRREWCSAVCGNRARVMRHYHRQRS